MHPVIRVLTLAALASALPGLGLLDLSLLAAALAAIYLLTAHAALHRLLQGLWRLRWLLMAIGIVYWAFTPGDPLHEALPGLSREGAIEGCRRALVLVTLLTAVYLMLAHTPQEDLMLAIRILAMPLRLFGLQPERLALRLSMALHDVGAAQSRLAAARGQGRESFFAAAARALQEVEQRAREEAPQEVALRPLSWPAAWQWLIPLALGLLLHRLAQ